MANINKILQGLTMETMISVKQSKGRVITKTVKEFYQPEFDGTEEEFMDNKIAPWIVSGKAWIAKDNNPEAKFNEKLNNESERIVNGSVAREEANKKEMVLNSSELITIEYTYGISSQKDASEFKEKMLRTYPVLDGKIFIHFDEERGFYLILKEVPKNIVRNLKFQKTTTKALDKTTTTISNGLKTTAVVAGTIIERGIAPLTKGVVSAGTIVAGDSVKALTSVGAHAIHVGIEETKYTSNRIKNDNSVQQAIASVTEVKWALRRMLNSKFGNSYNSNGVEVI